MIRREDSLEYHSIGRPGKIEVRASKPCLTPREVPTPARRSKTTRSRLSAVT